MRDDYVASCIDDEANQDDEDLPQTESRRRDYQLLLKFVKAVRFLRKEGCHPFIRNIPLQPPSISNARWNSRAIYSLFFELCRGANDNIASINTFIIGVRLFILIHTYLIAFCLGLGTCLV